MRQKEKKILYCEGGMVLEHVVQKRCPIPESAEGQVG